MSSWRSTLHKSRPSQTLCQNKSNSYYEDSGSLEYNAMWSGKNLPVFRIFTYCLRLHGQVVPEES
jgi:hypothetical protein